MMEVYTHVPPEKILKPQLVVQTSESAFVSQDILLLQIRWIVDNVTYSVKLVPDQIKINVRHVMKTQEYRVHSVFVMTGITELPTMAPVNLDMRPELHVQVQRIIIAHLAMTMDLSIHKDNVNGVQVGNTMT